jgi:hypothetical protein
MNGTVLAGGIAVTAVIGGVAPFAISRAEVEVKATAPASHAPQQQRTIDPCQQQVWPYYQSACVRDDRRPAGQAASVRLISADRRQAAK